jgi:hypothetical protein
MQKEFGIESSHLSYHLDGLGNLLHKTEDGQYELSNAGKVAFSMMKEVEGTRIAPRSHPTTVKKGQRKHFRLGRYSVPVWPVAILMVSMISSGVLGYYLYSSFTVPLEIKEPIEILDYPSQWSLYPGETTQFNVTVRNRSSFNYSVILDFRSDNMAYQLSYLAFSHENYTVVPGQQNLEAWLNVSADAPAANLNVTVTVSRGTEALNLLVNGDFETGTLTGWNVSGVCSASNAFVHSGMYSAYISDNRDSDNQIVQEVDLPADVDYHLEGWIYPLKVGNLGSAYSASAQIWLEFYNRSSMSHAFNVIYVWCWNNEHLVNGLNTNSSREVIFLLPFTASAWNLLSRNVTQDIHSYFAGINLSDYVLFSVRTRYHYSNGDPGAFYVDDLRISD